MANSHNSLAGFYSCYWVLFWLGLVLVFFPWDSQDLPKAWLQLALQVGF